ncbi:MAG: UxaA family hydrolase, partial [Verrucomicrobiota bacterium]
MDPKLTGYLRHDGRKGIRNYINVVYLVECAHHVAREITVPYRDKGVHVIGFSGCYPNEYSHNMLEQLCTHPNVGAVLLVSLGCEGFDRNRLKATIEASNRPVELIHIQNAGGTLKSIQAGRTWIEETHKILSTQKTIPMDIAELIVGTICGGSDSTSGITANPAIGHTFDHLVQDGATVMFEETGELIGCEDIMAARAQTHKLGEEILSCIEKAARYYTIMGHGSFAPGNAEGGLTTQEEKSLGAYIKSGSSPISGIIKPGDIPTKKGLYLLDIVTDGDVKFGFPNINDTAEIAELIACGSHIILFATARGSVVGSAVSPVIKVCANPETYARMQGDMDVDAGRILRGEDNPSIVGDEIYQQVLAVANRQQTASERLGHQEFVLTYKSFEPIGPACY